MMIHGLEQSVGWMFLNINLARAAELSTAICVMYH